MAAGRVDPAVEIALLVGVGRGAATAAMVAMMAVAVAIAVVTGGGATNVAGIGVENRDGTFSGHVGKIDFAEDALAMVAERGDFVVLFVGVGVGWWRRRRRR